MVPRAAALFANAGPRAEAVREGVIGGVDGFINGSEGFIRLKTTCLALCSSLQPGLKSNENVYGPAVPGGVGNVSRCRVAPMHSPTSGAPSMPRHPMRAGWARVLSMK